jgi:hypothetical protein
LFEVIRARKPWNEITSSSFGPASAVPERLQQARDAADPEDARYLVFDAVRYVADAGFLEESAPQMAADLLEQVARTPQRAAPFLHGLLNLLEPAHLEKGDARATPADTLHGFNGRWQDCKRWDSWLKLAKLGQEVEEEVRAQSAALLDVRGDQGVVAAAAVASLAGVERPSFWLSRASAIRSSPLSQMSMVISSLWIPPAEAGERAELRKLTSVLAPEAQDFAELLLKPDEYRPNELTRARLLRRREDRDPLEFVWVSAAFLAAASLARSHDPSVDDLLMEAADDEGTDEADHKEYGDYSQWTPSSSGSFWLLRRRLSRHWRQGVALGPGDLTSDEIAVLRRLLPRADGRSPASHTLHEFGIFHGQFQRDLPRLAGEIDDWLNGIHEGMFADTWVRWSRWKWLRNAWVQTHGLKRESRFAVANEIARQLLDAAPPNERAALKAIVDEEIRVVSTLGW